MLLESYNFLMPIWGSEVAVGGGNVCAKKILEKFCAVLLKKGLMFFKKGLDFFEKG
ncbi:MAG: hypothetical protein IIW46_05470 [Bacteroidaceae bacterium]|nr:hypothetical protein [Bacteroidaceae bacterium]